MNLLQQRVGKDVNDKELFVGDKIKITGIPCSENKYCRFIGKEGVIIGQEMGNHFSVIVEVEGIQFSTFTFYLQKKI